MTCERGIGLSMTQQLAAAERLGFPCKAYHGGNFMFFQMSATKGQYGMSQVIVMGIESRGDVGRHELSGD